jgi:hypothetical protein
MRLIELIKTLIKKLKLKIKNKMNTENKVTTYSGKEVPESEATYYTLVDEWITDEEKDDLLDRGDMVWDYYYDDYGWSSDCIFGYIDSSRNTGFFSNVAPWVRIHGYEKYAMTDTIADNLGFYEHNDGEWYDEPEEEECDYVYIWSYHSDNRKWFASDAAVFRIAFEVEKEDNDMKRQETAYECYNRTGWAKEHDGSLNKDTGFEFISPVFDLSLIDEHTFDNVEDYLNADYSPSCGGHVNLSHVTMTATELYETIKSYMPMLYALYPKRAKNTYCRAISKHEHPSEKYGSVYVKRDRLEIRIFSAVRSKENLLWRISLIRYMLENPNVSEATVLRNMLDGRSKLHRILRKVYRLDQIIEKGKLFYDYCRNYSFEIHETQNVLVKRRLMKKPKPKKKNTTLGLDPRWNDAIMVFDYEELPQEIIDEFFNVTERPMTTLPIETN